MKKLIVCIVFISWLHSETAASQATFEKLDNPFERWYITDEPMPDKFEEKALNYHPKFAYKLSVMLFKAGKKEQAVFWMYHGQLRYRALISCKNLGPWDTDYDTYVALDVDVNAEQNLWLGGDVQLWVDTLNNLAERYDPTRDTFMNKMNCGEAAVENIKSMQKFKDYLIENQASVREQRTERGLDNRSLEPVADSAKSAAGASR